MKQTLRFFDYLANLIVGLLAILLLLAIIGGAALLTVSMYDYNHWLGVLTGLVCFSFGWIVLRDITRVDG